MSLSTNQPIRYPSIKHLASIAEEETESIGLNPLTKEPLTQEDQEELNFPDVRTFLRHVEAAPKEVYDSIMRLWKHLVLVDKQNQKLKTRFTNYKKANESYVIDNAQLKTENRGLETQLVNLENQLANLKKQLEIACLDKRPTLSSLPLSPPSVSDDSDGNSKHSHHHF